MLHPAGLVTRLVIGLDLDNTLVSYDELFHELAVSEAFLSAGELQGLAPGKRALRQALRSQDKGEERWRKLQALAYGRHMPRARLMDGAAEFLAACARLRAGGASLELYIVSHKTRLANNYSDGADFHKAAMGFLEAQSFFAPGSGLTPERVFFEPTRAAKVARIAGLGCTHFVDDLEETFAEPGFPQGVTRILFDPAGDAADQQGVTRLRSWAAIAAALLAGLEPAPDFSALAGEAIAACQRIHGGRNSRVYRVLTASGRELAGKHYHQHQSDPRDRLGVEWRALSLLAGQARLAASVARPVAQAPAQGLALYTFLAGPQASVTPATGADMDTCLDFLDGLRQLAGSLAREVAAQIPPASEACFSLAALAANLRERLAALAAVPVGDCLGAELAEFLSGELAPFLEASLSRARCMQPLGAELPQAFRSLSPSDFGLHNALRAPGGLSFVDFEYFGWDDPAKTLCDFVLHPAMGLQPDLAERFTKGFLQAFDGDPGLRSRAAAVYPLFGAKWCLILLNEFLRAADARRKFAAGGAECSDADLTRRTIQLGKARAMLDQVRRTHETFPSVR